MLKSLRLLRAFLVRDFLTEVSYRFAFLSSLGGVFLNTLTFFFVSSLINTAASPLVLAQTQGDYFSFVLIGIAFGGYFGVGLRGFASALRNTQVTGTLEAMVMTPTPVALIILGSAMWSYAFTTFRVLLYLGLGTLLGLSFAGANYLGALASLGLAIIAFASLGIMAASVIMVIKRGDPVTGLFNGFANLIGGVYYPIEALPAWLQPISQALPITYALHAMRLALLSDASWAELAPDLLVLAGFCVILFPLSLIAFKLAVEQARQDGSLAQY